MKLRSLVALSIAVTSVWQMSAVAENKKGSSIVHISGFEFKPEKITVAKGTEVTFINDDSAPHTVTPDKGSDFDGITRLLKGEKGTIKFDNAGKQGYYCSIHPSMKGIVIVK